MPDDHREHEPMSERKLQWASNGFYIDFEDGVRLCWDVDSFNSVVRNEGDGWLVAGRRVRIKGDPVVVLRQEEFSLESAESFVASLQEALRWVKEHSADIAEHTCEEVSVGSTTPV